MNNGILVKRQLSFKRGHCGSRKMVSGKTPKPKVTPTRIPRVRSLDGLGHSFRTPGSKRRS